MKETEYRIVLAKQLAMNKETWAALQKHGINEKSQLSLDFTFNAPSKQAAEALQALIKEQTDYDVQVEEGKSFFIFSKWRVLGSTKSTAVSQQILDQWVEWMITAGYERDCVFDGWGAAVAPASK